MRRRAFPRSPRMGRDALPLRGVSVFLALLLPLLILLTVWQQASVDRLVVEVERERTLHRQLDGRVNTLRLEADRLSSLTQVESRAIEELGMHRPATGEIVELRFAGDPSRGSFGFVAEAQAASAPRTPR
jgi:cell division protein FtsL